MKNIITEEMKTRKRAVEYAKKYDNNAAAARKYRTSRQQIARWRARYDGTVESLRSRSRRPKSHPNAHKEEELEIIKKCNRRYRHEGLAEVYVQCQKRGYSRSYGSMCKMIRKMKLNKKEKEKKSYPKSTWKPEEASYPGEKVQIDIKHVPVVCVGWDSHGKKYYQITAIDEYTRKRVCEIVDEKSVTNTAKFVLSLEEKMGFEIKTIQTDNGREFVNDKEQKQRESKFEKVLREKNINYKRTRPYSPWQNGKVERSHREDGERFYSQVFKTEEEMIKKHIRYINRGNNIARKVLGFKTPNQIAEEYKTK